MFDRIDNPGWFREPMPAEPTEYQLEGRFFRKNYVYRMSMGKTRIRPETRARMRNERDEALLAWANAVFNRREDAALSALGQAALLGEPEDADGFPI